MNIYDYMVKGMQGQEVALSDYKGKLVLIVNTASKCGFAPQYEGLEKLYQKYKDDGFVVLGFPSNQFLDLEPGSNEEIQNFCKVNYGVTFPLFSKTDVRGDTAHPLFKALSDAAPFRGYELDKKEGKETRDLVKEYYPDNFEGNGIKWNFTKFLIGRDGKVMGRYEPSFLPEELDPVVKAAL